MEGKTAPSWWGFFSVLCLASQKPSEREFFNPTRMDLGVKLLTMGRWTHMMAQLQMGEYLCHHRSDCEMRIHFWGNPFL
jgi:hypothetical protein